MRSALYWKHVRTRALELPQETPWPLHAPSIIRPPRKVDTIAESRCILCCEVKCFRSDTMIYCSWWMFMRFIVCGNSLFHTIRLLRTNHSFQIALQSHWGGYNLVNDDFVVHSCVAAIVVWLQMGNLPSDSTISPSPLIFPKTPLDDWLHKWITGCLLFLLLPWFKNAIIDNTKKK